MCLLKYYILLLGLTYCLASPNATTCEERETARLKLDILKQCISDAKSLYPKCSDETDGSSDCSAKDRSLAHLNVALELISVSKTNCNPCPEPKVIQQEAKPIDCLDVQRMGFNKSGIFEIWPRWRNTESTSSGSESTLSSRSRSIEVYCDMETDGGGWTVIQRRGKFMYQTDFYQDWEAYKNGFGHLDEEFWLGNENIFALSNQAAYSARFDLVDQTGEYRYAVYSMFAVGDEKSQYILQIHNHKGNATEDMGSHNKMVFITKDMKNDIRNYAACALKQKAGFWFEPEAKSTFGHSCGRVNLNGLRTLSDPSDVAGMFWYQWTDKASLASTEIKLRRTYA